MPPTFFLGSSQIAQWCSHGQVQKLSSLKPDLPSNGGEVQSDQYAHWYEFPGDNER